MKSIVIVGTGVGSLTEEARVAIAQAELLLGAPRMLGMYPGKPSRQVYLPEEVAACIEASEAGQIAVLVSGDVGFYSAADGLLKRLAGHDVRFVPGVSSIGAFFAKLMLPWQDAALISSHGRDTNVVDTVRRNKMTFCLTGGGASRLGAALCEAGLGSVKTFAGENLGSADERVFETTAKKLANTQLSPLTVLLFINEGYDDSAAYGIADESFLRVNGIPMTKAEVRAVVISKLKLRPDSCCWDVGAGSGSVSVEAALAAFRGRVFAVERREDAINLIKQNLKSFHVGNVTVVHGEAPSALEGLPSPDSVFVGGGGAANLGGILRTALQKNPKARIVAAAVTLETQFAALAAFKDAQLEPEFVQINITRACTAGNSQLLKAQNPVTIISAGGGS